MYVSIVSRRNKQCTAKATEGKPTTTIIENHMNTDPRKHGLRATACWTLQQMLKMFILSFHAGTAGGRLLGPCVCSAAPDGRIVYRDFQISFLPELLQDLNLQTRIYLWFVQIVLDHIFFLHFGNSRTKCFRNNG